MAGMYPENKEITVFGKTVRFPGVNAEGKFTNGDFSNPDVPPSYLDADTLNLVIDNLNSLISHLGSEADNKNADQLSRLFTVSADADKAVKRDGSGRAKVAAPSEEDDIARKKEIDDIVNGIVEFKKLTVLGDIIQKGSNKVTHAEDVYTKMTKSISGKELSRLLRRASLQGLSLRCMTERQTEFSASTETELPGSETLTIPSLSPHAPRSPICSTELSPYGTPLQRDLRLRAELLFL